MADQEESLEEAIVRILRNAGKCLSASEIIAIRNQDEIGGAESIATILLDEVILKLPQIYKSGDKYCLKSKPAPLS